MEQTLPPVENPRLHKLNLGFLIGISALSLPIYGLLAIVLAFCDSPGAWCANPTNLRWLALFAWWIPLAIWLALLVGVIRKKPWRVAVWAGGALFTVMAGILLVLTVLTIYETA